MFEDGPCPGLKEMACLSDDVYDYFFPSQVNKFIQPYTCPNLTDISLSISRAR